MQKNFTHEKGFLHRYKLFVTVHARCTWLFSRCTHGAHTVHIVAQSHWRKILKFNLSSSCKMSVHRCAPCVHREKRSIWPVCTVCAPCQLLIKTLSERKTDHKECSIWQKKIPSEIKKMVTQKHPQVHCPTHCDGKQSEQNIEDKPDTLALSFSQYFCTTWTLWTGSSSFGSPPNLFPCPPFSFETYSTGKAFPSGLSFASGPLCFAPNSQTTFCIISEHLSPLLPPLPPPYPVNVDRPP